MDLSVAKRQPSAHLAACAVLAARNAQGLLHDAEVLANSGSNPGAFTLAALAVEEAGKARRRHVRGRA